MKKKTIPNLDPPPQLPVLWHAKNRRTGEIRSVISQTAYGAWRALALPLGFGAYSYEHE